TASSAEADEQRALEPAAMLVGALEIQIGRPGELRAHRQHSLVARSRIEPDIQNVHFLLEATTAAAGTRQTRRDEFFGRPLVPRVRAAGLEHFCGLLDERRRRNGFTAFRAV